MLKYQITNDTIKGRLCISNRYIRKGEIILIENQFLVIDIKEYKNIVQTLNLKINLLTHLECTHDSYKKSQTGCQKNCYRL